MLFTALTGFMFVAVDFPAWRIAVLIFLPALMGGVEMMLVRRIAPDNFDRVYFKISLIGLAVMTLITAITGGLRGPMAPFVFLSALIPMLVFGDNRFVMGQHIRVVAVIIILGFLPEEVLGPTMDVRYQALITASVAGCALYVITQRVRQFLASAKAGFLELDRMREERLAEASERLQRMQSVSSRIAHELKNPLAAIKSLVQLTAKSSDSKGCERLAVVEEEIVRMERILRDYLSFSRPLDDLKIAPLDVGEVLVDVREVLAARAENGNITLTPIIDRVPLRGDDRRLKEALINIVGNAIEATPAGGKVTLRCTPGPASAACGGFATDANGLMEALGTGATIVIEDSGRGMTPAELERVGTPYFTTRPDGTGLGVHLARGVILQHGGTITYESTPGVGTTVTITLPPTPPPASLAQVLEKVVAIAPVAMLRS